MSATSNTSSVEQAFGPQALRALLAQLPVAVFLADRQGRVVFANDAARRDITSLPDAVGAVLARALLTGEVVRDEEIALGPCPGPRRYASVSVTPLGADGIIDGALLTMADVTAARRCAEWTPVMESLARL